MKREGKNAAASSPVTFHASRFTALTAHPLAYEINTRCWLRELSERSGRAITLASVPDDEFQRWRRLGFTHLWLMGVWTTGPLSRQAALTAEAAAGDARAQNPNSLDFAGSPYAIAAYKVPESLGGESGLRQFRQKLHSHDIRLLLDFVPNHVGLDHPWINERPELLVPGPAAAAETFRSAAAGGERWLAHGRDPYFPSWTDTAQLDYRRPTTRAAMQAELLGIADRCDGVRCDEAMLVLNDVFARTWEKFPMDADGTSSSSKSSSEFWADAIAATKRAHPDFLFLAEVYWDLEERLLSLGFDFAYDKTLYDRLVGHDPSGVQRHLLKATPEFLEHGAHFLENHDEARAAALLAPAEHRAAALLILGLPGMRLLHDGQLDGIREKIPVQFSSRGSGSRVPEITELYEQLLAVLPKTSVGRGHAALLPPREAGPGNPTFQNILLVQWQAESPGFDLVAVNLAPHPSQSYSQPHVNNLSEYNWRMTDLLGREEYVRPGRELQNPGLYLDLPGYGAWLFQFRPVA